MNLRMSFEDLFKEHETTWIDPKSMAWFFFQAGAEAMFAKSAGAHFKGYAAGRIDGERKAVHEVVLRPQQKPDGFYDNSI